MIPSIGDKGIYTVSSPFDSVVSTGISYTCIALRSINDYVVKGVNILNNVYIANGLTVDDYKVAMNQDETIVTLQSSLGDTIELPSGYIEKMPDPNGRLYRASFITIGLGQLPTNLKLGTLCNELRDYVGAKLGIIPDVTVTELDKPHVVDNETHIQREHQRYNRITNSESMIAKIAKLTKENDQLNTLVNKLQEAYIQAKNS